MKRLTHTICALFVVAVISVLVVVLFKTDNTKDKEVNNKIYATDITISADFRSLTICLGNVVKFKKEPYTITPSNYNQGVEIKILNNLGEEKSGATFGNNCFEATQTGTFYVRFNVKTKYETIKHDEIKFKVLDEPGEDFQSIILKQKVKAITTNESLTLLDYVTIYNIGNSKVNFISNGGYIADGVFTADCVGMYNIDIIIDNNDYFIFAEFNVLVNIKEDISINLYNDKNTEIVDGEIIKTDLTNRIIMFSYIVKGLNSQRILLEIEKENIVSLQSSDAPLIVFNLLGKGETYIIIKIPNYDYKFKFVIKVE